MYVVGITERPRLPTLHIILFYSTSIPSYPVVLRQSFKVYAYKPLQIRPRPFPRHVKLGHDHFLRHHFIFLTHCLRCNSLLCSMISCKCRQYHLPYTSASPRHLQLARVIIVRLDTVWVCNGLRQVWRVSNLGASEVSTLATCTESQIKEQGTLLFTVLQSVVELAYINPQITPNSACKLSSDST